MKKLTFILVMLMVLGMMVCFSALAEESAEFWHVTIQNEGDGEKEYFGNPALRLPEGGWPGLCYPQQLNSNDAYSMELLLNDDGTCVFDCLGIEAQEGTWSTNGSTLTLILGGCTIDLSMQDDRLRYREEIGAELYHDLFFVPGDYASSDMARIAEAQPDVETEKTVMSAASNTTLWISNGFCESLEDAEYGFAYGGDMMALCIAEDETLSIRYGMAEELPPPPEGVPEIVQDAGASLVQNPDGTAVFRCMGSPEVTGVWTVLEDGSIAFEGNGWNYDPYEGICEEAVWAFTLLPLNERIQYFEIEWEGMTFYSVFERSSQLSADVMADDPTVRKDASAEEFYGRWCDGYELLSGGVKVPLDMAGMYLIVDQDGANFPTFGNAPAELNEEGAIVVPLPDRTATIRLHTDGLLSVQFDDGSGVTTVRYFIPMEG